MSDQAVLELTAGTFLLGMDGQDIEVLQPRLTADGLFMQYRRGGEVYERALGVAVQEIVQAHLPVSSLAPPRDLGLLATLGREQRDQLLQKQEHVRDVVFGREPGSGAYDQEKTNELQRRRIKENELGLKPRTGKVTGWVKRWKADGLPGLLHGNAKWPDAASEVSAPVLAVVRKYVHDERPLSGKALTKRYAVVLHELERQNLARTDEHKVDASGELLPLSEDLLQMETFKRLERSINRGANPAATAKSAQSRSRRPRNGPLRHRALEFGDVLQIDSMRCDFEVVCPDGSIVRAWLIIAVDVATRLCWVELVPGQPTGLDVGLLFHRMFAPAALSNMTDVYGPVAQVPRQANINMWPYHLDDVMPPVIPGIVTMDHGTEGENTHNLSVLAQWGTQIEWARTMNPDDKAHIESLNRTFAGLMQILPGHVGNAPENQPEKGAKRTRMSFRAAARIMRAFPIYYAAQPHLGLPHPGVANRFMTPNEACLASLARGVPLRIPADPSVCNRFLPHAPYIPHDDGVTIKKVTYWCEKGYGDLIALASAGGRKRSKLMFHFHPRDMTCIFWNEPDSFNWRTLWAPGGDGQEVAPLADVRDELAQVFPGHKRPTHKATAVANKDLVAVVERIVREDGAQPQVDFAYTTPASQDVVPSTVVPTHNGGWLLSDLAAIEALNWDGLGDEDEDEDEPW